MSVAAILVNYNGGDANMEAIDSLLDQVAEIIVVDNGSHDDSVSKIRARYGGRVTVIESRDNLGFGKACNLGVAATASPYLLFFNNDAVADPHMVRELVDAMEAAPALGIVGPLVYEYSQPDVVQSGIPTIDRWGFPVDALAGLHRGDPALRDAAEGFYIPGCALLIRRGAFAAARGFDEGMFMFVEDVDLCWRVQMLGYGIALVPSASCRHVGGGTAQMGQENGAYYTSETRIRMREENTIRMMLVNLGSGALMRYVAFFLPVIAAEAAVAAVLRKSAIARAYGQALVSAARQLPSIAKRRRWVQASRKRAQGELDRVWSPSYEKLRTLRRLGVPRVKSFTRST